MDEKSLVRVVDGEYIAVKQLPIIEDKLAELHQQLQGELDAVRSLAPTEENYKELKKIRADWNKKIDVLESLRKKVKTEIEAPYKQFEKGPYASLVNEMRDAVGQLDSGIKDVENILKSDKQRKLAAYYEEYRQSISLDEKLADPRRSNITIGLSDSLKSKKEEAKKHLDRIANDVKTIEALENRDEIMAEYRISLDLSSAIQTVKDRIAREEAVRRAREEAEAARLAREAHEAEVNAAMEEAAEATETPSETQEDSDDILSPPSAEKLPEEATEQQEANEAEPAYQTAFRVTGTLEMLRALKRFLVDGGYVFETIKEGE